MDLELNGKVAVITGGSLGIGKAIAQELALEGARVVICARRPELLQDAARDIEQETGGKVLAVPTDTTQPDQVANLFNVTIAEFGSVDILVNNAAVVGGLLQGPLEEATEELLTEDLDTKVVGYFRTAQAAAPLMKEQGWGRIINIGGMSGRYSGVISGVRNAAVAHLTKTLSGQLGPYGITVNTIHPGTVRTERTDEMYEEEALATGVPQGRHRPTSGQSAIDRTHRRIRRDSAPGVLPGLPKGRSHHGRGYCGGRRPWLGGVLLEQAGQKLQGIREAIYPAFPYHGSRAQEVIRPSCGCAHGRLKAKDASGARGIGISPNGTSMITGALRSSA